MSPHPHRPNSPSVTTRRRWMTAVALQAALFLLTIPRAGRAAEVPPDEANRSGSQFTFRWAVRAGDQRTLVTALRNASATVSPNTEPFRPPAEEATDYSDPAFSPLIVIVGVAAISVIAEEVVRFYRSITHGGVIIDTRGKDLMVRENPAIPSGMVIVVGTSGTIKFEPQSTIDGPAIINAVAKLKR